MGIKSFNVELCVAGCGLCVEECPTDVFAIDQDTDKARVAYPEDCWECLLCEDRCPGNAIKISPAAVRKLWYPF